MTPTSIQNVYKLNAKEAKPMMAHAFPDYEGRTFKLAIQSAYRISGSDLMWGGGSKTEVVILAQDGEGNIGAMALSDSFSNAGNTYQGQIPDHVMVVEYARCMGKDCGLRFIVSPNSKFLPAGALPPAAVAA